MTTRQLAAASILVCLCPSHSDAQPAAPVPRAPVIEVSAGWAGFVDESTIDHALIGASSRWHLTRRLALGPEIVYMRGPGHDRDLFVTGNLTFDLLRPAQGRRLMPYVVAGAGLMSHVDRFGGVRFRSHEGAVTAGGGVRLRITPRMSIGGEARTGWEPHVRMSGHVGLQLGEH
jgi:hypothetical protein